MYVKDHMTAHPVTISKETSLLDALEIMGKNHFHRLPVVENGKLIGLVTEGLVDETSGRDKTSLSIYELNYLLSRTTAADIMITDVKTVSPDAWIEEASQLMLDSAINALPVVNEENEVMGLITEKDLFRAYLDVMGYKRRGTRFVIKMDDKPGEFARLCGLFAKEDANIENIGLYHSEERGVEAVVRATGEVSVEDMTKVLEDGGYQLLSVWQTK